jgi:predicted lipoprotein
MTRKDAGHSSSSRRRNAIAIASLLGALAACKKPVPDERVFVGGENTGGGPIAAVDASAPAPFDGGTVDASFTVPRFLDAMATCAASRVDLLGSATESLAASLRGDADAGAPADPRAAWRQTFEALQEVEVFGLGPYAHAPVIGGEGIRDEIYPWPLVSRCRIEEQLVAKAYEGPGFASTLVNGRGLTAVEFLLFSQDRANACSSFSTINANGTWAALAPVDLDARRAAYARAAAEDVASRVRGLVAGWASNGGNFRVALASAGAGSSLFATEASALNALTDAVIYVDESVKDWKLGKPAGFFECTTGTCPGAVEAPYARASKDALVANLRATRRIVQGCGREYSGLGVDDWLASKGAGDLAARVLGALVAAQAAVDALDGPVDDVLARDPSKIAQAHANVKAFTTLWKAEALPALTMTLPTSAQGDND